MLNRDPWNGISYSISVSLEFVRHSCLPFSFTAKCVKFASPPEATGGLAPLSSQEPLASILLFGFFSSNGNLRSNDQMQLQALPSSLHGDNEVSIHVSGKWMVTLAIDLQTGQEQYYHNPHQSV